MIWKMIWKMIWLEHFFFEERLWDVSLLSLEMRRLWRRFVVALQYLKGVHKQEGVTFYVI